MSSYSGFSSRKIQDKYNHYLKELFALLSQIIISQIDSTKLAPFKSTYHKLQSELKKLDPQKYSDPKFSKVLEPLTQHIQSLDLIKQWHSQPQKKKSRSFVQNNFIRTRNVSMDEARRTISFTTSTTQKNQYQKPLLFKQNRYHFQQSLGEYNRQKPTDNLRNKKIYRSRQVSAHLIPAQDIKPNSDHNQTFSHPDNELSMEELMKKNPLIERKMSAHRKRRLIKFDFPQIRQEEEEEGEQIQQDNYSTSKFMNEESFTKFEIGDGSSKEYFGNKYTKLQDFSQLEDRQVQKQFVRT